VTALALVFTSLVTPFEVGFSKDQSINTMFFLDRIVDLIFLTDLGMQFFIAYQSNDAYGGTFWVEDMRLIASRAHTIPPSNW
jgi:hypothetical protein